MFLMLDCASAKRRGMVADASCLRAMFHPDGICERRSWTMKRERVGSELAARPRDNKMNGRSKGRITGEREMMGLLRDPPVFYNMC